MATTRGPNPAIPAMTLRRLFTPLPRPVAAAQAAPLVYDVGMNHRDDCAYYVRKG